MIEFEIVGTTKHGEDKIKFTNNKYSDIIFNVGRVHFGTNPEDPRLNFEYNIHLQPVGLEFNKNEFEALVAEFIMERIRIGLERNDLIYTGGIDED